MRMRLSHEDALPTMPPVCKNEADPGAVSPIKYILVFCTERSLEGGGIQLEVMSVILQVKAGKGDKQGILCKKKKNFSNNLTCSDIELQSIPSLTLSYLVCMSLYTHIHHLRFCLYFLI